VDDPSALLRNRITWFPWSAVPAMPLERYETRTPPKPRSGRVSSKR